MISNTDSDIRWKQRFSNLKKAFDCLSQALAIDNPDIVQRAGIIQFFEMSFELSWKTIKDYLEYNGFEEQNSPRTVLKTAFQANICDVATVNRNPRAPSGPCAGCDSTAVWNPSSFFSNFLQGYAVR